MANLAIRGPIESPASFISALDSAAGKAVTIEINSIGGSAWAGFRMYHALARHRGHATVRITALAASAASVIAMAADDIVIDPRARMMIHSAAMTINGGGSKYLRESANLLDRINASMANAYAARTGRPLAEVMEMMESETWFSAGEAVAMGFADRIHGQKQSAVEGLNAIAASVYRRGPWARIRA